MQDDDRQEIMEKRSSLRTWVTRGKKIRFLNRVGGCTVSCIGRLIYVRR